MRAALPGLGLAGLIALIAVTVTRLMGIPGSSPLLLAIVLGMLWRACLGVPEAVRAGLARAVRQTLRVGVTMLGFQLTLGELVSVGLRGVAIAVIVLVSTFVFTRWLGRLLDVDSRLAQLIAAGTSICGASAIVGVNALTRAEDEDVSYSIATVTVMGLVSMLVYPPLSVWLRLRPQDYGIWVGSSIHEVAQVVAAGFQGGVAAGQVATFVKLTRVLMLAPALLTAWLIGSRGRGSTQARIDVPWFVLAFVAAVLVNSAEVIPVGVHNLLVISVPLILTLGLAGVGIDTDARALVRRGVRPFLLALSATSFIAVLSLVLIALSSPA